MPVGRLLWRYSLPAIVGMMVTALYNVIDRIFIGQGVGPEAIAGLAITFPVMNLSAALGVLIGAGGSARISILLGAKDYDGASRTLGNALVTLMFIIVVYLSCFALFIDEILVAFGASEVTLPYARDFMLYILPGMLMTNFAFTFNNFMRVSGYPIKAMITMFIGAGLNVCLAPLFIFKFGWGIKGAAIATVSGQTVACAWVLWHFLSKKSYIHLQRERRWLTPDIIRRIYAIGLSPFLMNICACVVVVFINKALLDYGASAGNLAVGAYGILNRTTMFFIMIVFGVTQGMQPILGYNYGAGQWDRVKSTLRIGIWLGVAITSVGWIATECFPDAISSLFTVDPTLIEIANRGSRIYFFFYPLVGCQIVIQNFFQSVGKPKVSIFLSLTRQLLFLIPFLIILPRYWGIDGVWASMAASDFIAFIFAIVTLIIVSRRQTREFDKSRLQTQ